MWQGVHCAHSHPHAAPEAAHDSSIDISTQKAGFTQCCTSLAQTTKKCAQKVDIDVVLGPYRTPTPSQACQPHVLGPYRTPTPSQ